MPLWTSKGPGSRSLAQTNKIITGKTNNGSSIIIRPLKDLKEFAIRSLGPTTASHLPRHLWSSSGVNREDHVMSLN